LESEPDNLYLFTFSLLTQLLFTVNIELILLCFLIIGLLLCSALVSGSEIAFFSITANQMNALEQETAKPAQRLVDLKEDPRKLLATILISNNFINIGIVLISEYTLSRIISNEMANGWAESLCESAFISSFFKGERLENLENLKLFEISPCVTNLSTAIYFTITVVVVTFLLVLFGEVMPKVYAKFNNVSLAKSMSGVLTGLTRLFNPISSLLVDGTNVIERRLTKHSQNGNLTSREDIDEAIDLTVKDQKHALEDSNILKGIVNFGDVAVKQIMCSRVDVIGVDFSVSYKELLAVVKESGYSRIPVYKEDFDHVTGILYVKDLLPHLQEDENYEWQELIRANVFYVPEAKKIDDLLREFQTERLHMAVVVDEFGGSAGIVTLEDILEEIVGEIRDEFDDTEIEYQKLDNYNYLFEGKTLLNDMCRIIGVPTTTFDEVKNDADTLAGLFLELKGMIPKVGEEVLQEGYTFQAKDVNRRRIKQIKVTLENDPNLNS